MIYVIVGLIAYCIGSISFSVIITKKWQDLMLEIREVKMQEVQMC